MFDKKYIIEKVKQQKLYKQVMKMLPEEERKKVELRFHAYAAYVSKSMIEPVLEAKFDEAQAEEFRKKFEQKIKEGKVTGEKHGKPLEPKE
jgi:hypothetical protein